MIKIVIGADFKRDYITRVAGERLREMILHSDSDNLNIEIDFTGVTVGSVTFFDEGLAKLADSHWDRKKFNSRVKFKDLNPLDLKLLEQVLKFRKW